MHQSVKLTGEIWPLIHALVWPESSPYQDLNPAWEVDDLPTELSLLLVVRYTIISEQHLKKYIGNIISNIRELNEVRQIKNIYV